MSFGKAFAAVFLGIVAALGLFLIVVDIKRGIDRDAELTKSAERSNEDAQRRDGVNRAIFGPRETATPWTREDELKRREDIARRAGGSPSN